VKYAPRPIIQDAFIQLSAGAPGCGMANRRMIIYVLALAPVKKAGTICMRAFTIQGNAQLIPHQRATERNG
jgi:hypothetical protein